MSRPLISAVTLAAMRRTMGRAHPDTATISRPTYVSDDQGGRTEGAPSTSTSACRVVRSQQTREVTIGDQTRVMRLTNIYFPAGTDVRDDDRITVDGVVFQVITAMTPESYEVERQAECVEVS